MSKHTVKARGRHGTKSLDLTIPAKLSKEHDLGPGDLFKVKIKNENEKLIIEYELIYKNE